MFIIIDVFSVDVSACFGFFFKGSALRYGDYDCNIPERTFSLFLDKINQMNPQPEFIIYTGQLNMNNDLLNINHIFDANSHVIDYSKYIGRCHFSREYFCFTISTLYQQFIIKTFK